MSKWAQAKQVIELDWRQEWRHIAQGTMGELDGTTLHEAVLLLEQLESAYQRKDKLSWLAAKAQLVKHRSWTGSNATSNDNPAASSAKPTAAPTQLGWLT